MKCLLLLAAFVAVATARDDCRVFQRIFTYEAQMVNGMIPFSPLRNGLKIVLTAFFEHDCANNVHVRFYDVKMHKIDLSSGEAETELIRDEELTDILGVTQMSISKALHMPFAFKYTNGEISKVVFQDNDWTVAIKKGFMSLFQVNFEKKLLVQGEPELNMEDGEQFTVMEASPTGLCATRYYLKWFVVKEEAKESMSLFKVRDYNRCVFGTGFTSSPIFDGANMQDTITTDPLSHTSNIKVAIRGNKDDFHITSAIGEERIVFSAAYNPKEANEELRTTLNQTLVLYSTDEIVRDGPLPPLNPSAATKVLHSAAHLATTPASRAKFTYSVQKIIAELRLMAENIIAITSQDSLTRMKMITDILRNSPYANIEEVFKTLKTSKAPIDQKALDIMWNVLAHVGSDDAVNFVIDTCSKDSTMIKQCNGIMPKLSFVAFPTKEIIDKMIVLTKSSTRQDRSWMMSLHLTLGAFVHKYRMLSKQEIEKSQKEIALLTPLSNEKDTEWRKFIIQEINLLKEGIAMKINEVKTVSASVLKVFTDLLKTDDKILALKSLKNAGLSDSVKTLQDYITDDDIKKLHPYTRIDAVLAFSKIHRYAPSRAKAIVFLLDLVLDPTEANEMRTTAFQVLMELRADASVLDMIMSKLHYEQDAYLTSYVLSFLGSFANSTYEPVMAVSKMAIDALKSAPAYESGLGRSFFKFSGSYSEKLRKGAAYAVSSHGSFDRWTSFDIGVSTVAFGKEVSPFGINIVSTGLATIIEKVFGPKGVNDMSKSLRDLLKADFDILNAKPVDIIKHISAQLKMAPRVLEEYFGIISIRMYGNEVQFFSSLEELIKFFAPVESASKLRLSMTGSGITAQLPLDIATAYEISDDRMSMLTEVGMPVTAQMQLAASKEVKGTINFEAKLPTEGSAVFLPENIAVNVDMYNKINLGVAATMGLDIPWVKPAVGFHGLMKIDAPLKTSTIADLRMLQVVTKFTPPTQDKPVIETIIEPISEVVTVFNNTGSPSMALIRKPIYNSDNQRVHPVSLTLPCPVLGHLFTITGQGPVESSYPVTCSPFLGRSEMKFSMLRSINSPKEITISYAALLTTTTPKESIDQAAYMKDGDYNIKGLTAGMVLKKLMKIGGAKDLNRPLSIFDQSFILSINASSPAVRRIVTVEFSKFWNHWDSTQQFYFRISRSPIQGWYSTPFQFYVSGLYNTPRRVYLPEDVYDVAWQEEINNNLETHTWLDTPEFKNGITVTTNAQTAAGQILNRPPVSRVLDSIVPEVYFNSKNRNHSLLITRYAQIEAEYQITVDPTYTNKDYEIYDYQRDIRDLQKQKVDYLNSVLKQNGAMPLADFVYATWNVMKHQHAVSMLCDIVVKYTTNGIISNDAQNLLIRKESLALLEQEFALLKQVLLQKKLSYYRAVSPTVSDERFTIPLSKQPPVDWAHLNITANTPVEQIFSYVQAYWLVQLDTLIAVEQSIEAVYNEEAPANVMDKFLNLTVTFEKLLPAIDSALARNLTTEQPGPFFLTVCTTLSEILVYQWKTAMKMFPLNGQTLPTSIHMETHEVDLAIKTISSESSARASLVKAANKILNVHRQTELPQDTLIRERMLYVESIMLIESSYLRMYKLQRHPTPKNFNASSIIEKIDLSLQLVNESEAMLVNMTRKPNAYLISCIADAIGRIHTLMVHSRQVLLSSTAPERLALIAELDKLSFRSTLVRAAFKPIFQRSLPAPKPVLPVTKPVPVGPGPVVPSSWPNAIENPDGIYGAVVVSWGTEQLHSTLLTEIFATRSVEQIMWIKKQMNPSSMDPMVITAIQKRMAGAPVYRDSVMDLLNSYNHVETKSTWLLSAKPVWLVRASASITGMLRHSLWGYLSPKTVPTTQVTSETEIQTKIDITSKFQMDLSVVSSGSKVSFDAIPLSPSLIKSLNPTSGIRTVSDSFSEYLSGGSMPATCQLTSSQVESFDMVSYALPRVLDNCRTVLAMDCGATPRFLVALGEFNKQANARMVEIVTPLRKVQVVPGKNTTDVHIDGKAITIAANSLVADGEIVVTRLGSAVQVILQKSRISITVDGDKVNVEVSQMYKNMMCGLCGNFDGRPTWEFEGPQREIYSNQTAFALSYAMPSSKCPKTPELRIKDMNPIPKPCHIDFSKIAQRHNMMEVALPAGGDEKMECIVEYQTLIKVFRRKNLICFSQRPVSECSFDCNGDKVNVVREKMLFQCLDRTSDAARSLLKRVRREGYIVKREDLIKDAKKNLYRKVTFEKNCKA